MRKLFLAAVLVLMASGAQAVTLNVVGGQLMGASDVLVDGNLYDVQFLDGTCIDLFNGCDEVSDFTFQTQASALLASQALLDQVFLDVAQNLQFDSRPWGTNGCSEGGQFNLCDATTVFTDLPQGLVDVTLVARNCGLDPADCADAAYTVQPNTPFYASGWHDATYDSSAGDLHDEIVYAVWSPVPEPSTALLLGIGLVGMAARRRV